MKTGIYAILHKPWQADGDKTGIIGYWAEDDTPYFLTVPEQLRGQIILMQNNLSNKYNSLKELRVKLLDAEKSFNKSLGLD